MSHPVAAGSNGMRNFSLPSPIQTTYTDAFDFLRRIMRSTVVQKSMGSNDVAEGNGHGPKGSDSPNWRSCISTISLSRITRIEKLDARMEDQSAPP